MRGGRPPQLHQGARLLVSLMGDRNCRVELCPEALPWGPIKLSFLSTSPCYSLVAWLWVEKDLGWAFSSHGPC